jgi:hypothetical protein
MLRTTTVIYDADPMQYILSHQILGGRYSKWIVIIQEFDLEVSTVNSKKSLVFTKLMIDHGLGDSKESSSPIFQFS